jgi:hypothetical protein
MAKKYAILAAAFVASGRSVPTASVLEQDRREPKSRAHIADDWPFCDRSALAFSFEEQIRDEPAPAASLRGIPRSL